MPLEIRPDHMRTVLEVLNRLIPDRAVWAFGSRATWTARDTSDLDLAVIGNSPLDFRTLAALRDAFSESNIPYKVDVVDWATISETFREIIRKDKIVIKKEGSSVSLDLPLKKPPFGWKEDRLDTIADFNPEQVDNKYPHILIQYLDISGISRGLVGNPELLALEEAPSRAKRIVRENDTIISTVRPGNRAYAFLKKVPNNLVVSTGFSVLRAKGCSPRFLYYLSTSDSIIDYLASIAEEKTAYPSVNPKDIAECRVFIPPLPEQRAIAHILGTLDDKIELNRRMNETLEAMAQALFKSWFVDFDPVRAKMEGRPTGLPKEIEDLFPDSFEDSELGEIPRGWKVVRVGEVFDFNPTEKVQKGKELPYLDMASIPSQGSWPDPTIMRPFSSGSKFRNGDTLFARITPCLENGKTAFIQLLKEEGIAWGSTEFIVIRPRDPFPKEFGYLLARDSAFREHAIQSMSGTSGRQRVQVDSLSTFKTVAPDRRILKVFGVLIHKWFQTIKLNSEQISGLAQTREILLPKLLSGEIRVTHLEKILEQTL